MPSRLQFPANLIVVSQKTNVDRIVQIEEKEAKVAVTTAFEKTPPQFADSNTAVDMRTAKSL